MDGGLIMALLTGAVPGFLVGRWWAEVFRAKADMRKVWSHRGAYRGRR